MIENFYNLLVWHEWKKLWLPYNVNIVKKIVGDSAACWIAQNYGLRGLGSCPSQGHCVVMGQSTWVTLTLPFSLMVNIKSVFVRIFRDSGQKSALVFIHRLQSVDSFVWELRELGINAVALYKQAANQDHEEYQKFLTDFQTGKINVVVGTEETVRGLDFKELDHVYLTEVAKNIDEYLHLAGRVGRQGRPGTATTLVSTKDPREEIRMKLEYRRLELPFEQIILWLEMTLKLIKFYANNSARVLTGTCICFWKLTFCAARVEILPETFCTDGYLKRWLLCPLNGFVPLFLY